MCIQCIIRIRKFDIFTRIRKKSTEKSIYNHEFHIITITKQKTKKLFLNLNRIYF